MFNVGVSIIMPAYNVEQFISESIKSVLAQTYQDWELIIVDDNSTDNTYEIAKSYAESDGRIKVIRFSENRGAALARNAAIEAAKGKYIVFLDSDDLWLPHKLEEQLEFMRENDLAFTYSSYELIDEAGKSLGIFLTKESITYSSMLKTCDVGCLTAIYDSYSLGKMYFNIECRRQEDYALWLAILKRIKETKGILEPLAKYRIRSGSISRNKLKAAWYQWKVYREVEKLSLLKSAYYFCHYAWNGFFKYRRARNPNAAGI